MDSGETIGVNSICVVTALWLSTAKEVQVVFERPVKGNGNAYRTTQ